MRSALGISRTPVPSKHPPLPHKKLTKPPISIRNTNPLSNRAWGTKFVPGSTFNNKTTIAKPPSPPNGPHVQVTITSSWGNPLQTGTSFDLRTDAITTPSLRQLNAIARATLNDDVFSEDRSTANFENHMAGICGTEAAAFVVSGTMANQLALSALLGRPPQTVLVDYSAHVANFEAGGMVDAGLVGVRPGNGVYLTVEDVKRHAKLESTCPREVCHTGVVSLEDTVHGNVLPLRELRGIKEWAGKNRISVHIDGARVWHAVAAGGGSLKEIASCADAMTLSLAKEMGAPIGAVIVGSGEVIRRVKRLRQRIGGGVRKFGMLAAAAREALLENWGEGEKNERETFGLTHDMALNVARIWTSRGGRLTRPVETNLVWLDLERAGVEVGMLNKVGLGRGLLVNAPRIVLHHQIGEEALFALEGAFDDVLVQRHGAKGNVDGLDMFGTSKGCVMGVDG